LFESFTKIWEVEVYVEQVYATVQRKESRSLQDKDEMLVILYMVFFQDQPFKKMPTATYCTM
jgi:hypothetical protein